MDAQLGYSHDSGSYLPQPRLHAKNRHCLMIADFQKFLQIIYTWGLPKEACLGYNSSLGKEGRGTLQGG